MLINWYKAWQLGHGSLRAFVIFFLFLCGAFFLAALPAASILSRSSSRILSAQKINFVQPKGFIYICNQKVSLKYEKRRFPGYSGPYEKRDLK
jgi:hypothetical protein